MRSPRSGSVNNRRSRRPSKARTLELHYHAEPQLQSLDILTYMSKAEEEVPSWTQLKAEEKDEFREMRFGKCMHDKPTQHVTMVLALLIFAALGAMVSEVCI